MRLSSVGVGTVREFRNAMNEKTGELAKQSEDGCFND
jgi:hypothetical protein